MRCQSCGADLPEDAQFCIECGSTVTRTEASTGSTVVLPQKPGLACSSCGAINPDFAVFCVQCGQRISSTEQRVQLSRADDADVARADAANSVVRGWPQAGKRMLGGSSIVILLIGLALLFMLRLPIWPMILIVVGISTFVNEATRGRLYNGLSSVLWLFGLAMLFTIPRLLFPGLLILIALSIVLSFARRALRIP